MRSVLPPSDFPRPHAPILPCLALALLASGCSPAGPEELAPAPPPPHLDARFEPVAVLGGDAGDAVLGAPRTVRTALTGEIFVADLLSASVRVFSPDGEPLREVGRRGREPGSFLGVQAMAVTPHGELLVGDTLNRRITRFSFDGEVVATHELESGLPQAPRELLALPEGGVLAMGPVEELETRPRFGGRSDRPDPGPLLHELDERLGRRAASFLGTSDLLAEGESPDDLDTILAQLDAGSLWLTSDGSLLIAPFMYRGTILRYVRGADGWRQAGTLRGWVADPTPFVAADPEAVDPATLNLVSRGASGAAGAIFHNESRGLFELPDGRVVHFSFARQGGERVFGVELFGADRELVGYAPIERVPHTEGRMSTLPLYVEWMDDSGRFYLRDEREAPTVRVVELVVSPPEAVAAGGGR